MRSLPRPTLLELALLLAGGVLTLQYGWLLDDAFIYFRYADNAVHLGYGLVYNAGEAVEGFTSPLWMLFLAAARFCGANWWLLIRVVGVGAWLGTGYGLIRLNRRLSPPGAPVVNLPLAYLALNYAVLCYFTSGMETPLVQAAAVATALFFVHPRRRSLQIIQGLLPVLRPELALVTLFSALWAAVRLRRPPAALLAALAAGPGGWLLFRVAYYADLLPNTYYLKHGAHPARGLAYLRDTAGAYHLGEFLLLAGILAVFTARRGSQASSAQAARAGMLAAAALSGLYVVWVGGDPRHYRYLAFPFCLAVAATAGLAESALEGRDRRWTRLAPAGGLVLALAVFSFYPRQLDRHPLRRPLAWHMVDGINDAAYHRFHPDLARPAWGWHSDARRKAGYRRFVAENRGYRGVQVSGWCAAHDAAYDHRVVHSLGLTDALLARMVMPARRPGHKTGLRPLARELAALYPADGSTPKADFVGRAATLGQAPPWLAGQLPAVTAVHARVFNRGRLWANLRQALHPIPPIQPPEGAR